MPQTSSLVWPELPLAAWQDTRDTLHMWTQVIGKVRLELSPHFNHWWEVPFYCERRRTEHFACPLCGRHLRRGI